ncbi:MAG: type II CRISPR-associated endonuclease Cas1 [Verrucomicrobiota bacterium]
MSAKRILEVSNPAHVSTSRKQLLINQKECLVASIPLDDLECVILSHPQITVTQPLLKECSKAEVVVIICDERHMPIGYYFSPFAHNLHSKILKHQVEAGVTLKKKLWKKIVETKILHQALVLKLKNKDFSFILNLSKRVKSGDSDNYEAQAAAYYWPNLFGKKFRRDPHIDGINSLLNYGYAIMRASTTRAIVGTGLNPSLGLFHRNQYNSFCLADDLMEIVRPLIDSKVYEICVDFIPELNQETKSHLLSTLQSEVKFDGLNYFLTDALERCATSLAQALQLQDAKLFKCLSL